MSWVAPPQVRRDAAPPAGADLWVSVFSNKANGSPWPSLSTLYSFLSDLAMSYPGYPPPAGGYPPGAPGKKVWGLWGRDCPLVRGSRHGEWGSDGAFQSFPCSLHSCTAQPDGKGLEKSLGPGARRGQGLKPLLKSQDEARPQSLAILADRNRRTCSHSLRLSFLLCK